MIPPPHCKGNPLAARRLPDAAEFRASLASLAAAGCGVVAHSDFPFRRLPLAEAWRFDLPPRGEGAGAAPPVRPLAAVLERLRREARDFRRDNPRLVRLIESDWSARVRRIFADAPAAAQADAPASAPAAPAVAPRRRAA
jgi:hypothetical protein